MRVLLVDDNLTLLGAIERALTRHGFRVTAVSGAGEALRRARETAPQVVITDLWLDQITGVELIRALMDEQCGARFVLLTGDSDFVLPRDLEAGVALCAKPIRVEELIDVARQGAGSRGDGSHGRDIAQSKP